MNENEQNLERWMHGELKALPNSPAPADLRQSILAEIGRLHAQPVPRAGWKQWRWWQRALALAGMTGACLLSALAGSSSGRVLAVLRTWLGEGAALFENVLEIVASLGNGAGGILSLNHFLIIGVVMLAAYFSTLLGVTGLVRLNFTRKPL